MPDPATDTNEAPKRRRYGWWLFFALVVLLASLALTFFVPCYRQLALIERIEAAGGIVNTKPVGPEWVRNLLGEERMRGFDDVVGMTVADPLIDDEWLRKIADFTYLERLDLSNTQITDQGLILLKGLTSLEALSLENTQISGSGLLHLREIKTLKHLNLNYTQLSDAGLAHMKEFTSLDSISLHYSQVSLHAFFEFQIDSPDCQMWW